MQTPLVSVVMTTYNHAPYLRQAIEGVLAQQTPFDVELVLGEDCSTDATPAICREYAERYPGRVRLVTGPANVGWRANYRRTFEACRGRYVAYCDGDDWWEDPHKLCRQVERLETDPSCGLCYTRTERCDQATGVRTPFPAECSTRFDRMVFRNPVDNCCAVARRELVARYYAEVRPEEHPEWLTDDQPMWLWCALHAGVCFVDAVTAGAPRAARQRSTATSTAGGSPSSTRSATSGCGWMRATTAGGAAADCCASVRPTPCGCCRTTAGSASTSRAGGATCGARRGCCSAPRGTGCW